MPAQDLKLKRVWTLTVVVFLLLLAGILFLLNIEFEPVPSQRIKEPDRGFRVYIDSVSMAVEENEVAVALFDTAPLYLPTKWNYTGQKNLQTFNAKSSFGTSLAPTLSLGRVNFFKARNLDEAIILSDLAEITDAEELSSFSSFGRVDAGAISEERNDAFYQITDLDAGRRIGVPVGVSLKQEGLGGRIWHSISLLFQVTDMGIGKMMVQDSSNLEEVEEHFKQYFRKNRYIHDLPVGYYRIDIWM